MNTDVLARRTIHYVNIAHALDHFVILIYPTAVLAIAAERGVDYATLIGLATGTFVAFGLFSLPIGWLADRVGRRTLLAAFFLGCGAALVGLATTSSDVGFAIWLTVLGIFSAIYHPIGTAMLVSQTEKLGRDLGWNGVWGNLGAASASGVTALIAAWLGWRAAFIVPGLVCLAIGFLFLRMVPSDPSGGGKAGGGNEIIPVSRPALLLGMFALALVMGGLTFNITTIALPKAIDERLGLALPLTLIGSLATVVFVFGALTQLLMGRLIDRFSLPSIFVGLSVLQPVGLALAAFSSGYLLLLGLVLAMAAIYGQVVINDAMIARYVPADYRARAYSVRYFLGFTTSGFAVPLIALLHAQGGFPVVLGVTALFGSVIFAAAIGFVMVARPPREAQPAAAE